MLADRYTHREQYVYKSQIMAWHESGLLLASASQKIAVLKQGASGTIVDYLNRCDDLEAGKTREERSKGRDIALATVRTEYLHGLTWQKSRSPKRRLGRIFTEYPCPF